MNKEQTNLDITPKNDIVFQTIFGSVGNEEILKDFLESILDVKIDSLTLDLNRSLLPEFYDGKQSRVDVRSRLSDGTEVNIEMQMKASDYSDKRCLQHWSKIYSNTLKKGKTYTDLRKTICIWLIDGKIYDEFNDFDSKWEIMNKKHNISNHFNELEIYIIELQKLKNYDRIKSSKKDFWLWFIDHTNEELINMACNNNEKIKEAREQLEKIRADEILMERIRQEENFEFDMNTRLENAAEEGKLETQKETTKRMLELGLEIEIIEKATGLSKEEIEKIKEEK